MSSYYRCDACGYSPALSDRILAYVRENPGASVRDVRDGVTGRAQEIGATIAALVGNGRLKDRGERHRELYAGNRPGNRVGRAGPPPPTKRVVGPPTPSSPKGASPSPSTASTGVHDAR